MKLLENDHYWWVVTDCLVELHGQSRPKAGQLVHGLLDDLRARESCADVNMIYHVEQFEIANGLAGEKLSRAACAEHYDMIVARHYAGVPTG